MIAQEVHIAGVWAALLRKVFLTFSWSNFNPCLQVGAREKTVAIFV